MMSRTVVLPLLLSWIVQAQTPIGELPEPVRFVTVCLDSRTPTFHAEKIATRIFARIRVNLNWVWIARHCPADALRLSLTGNTPAHLLPGALAYARPYEGSEMRIFVDRVAAACDYPPKLCGRVLGHVMAHEIAHMIQGVGRHSSEGVMKPKWSPSDFAAMRVKLLQFVPLDVMLIHTGVDTRAARAPLPVTQ